MALSGENIGKQIIYNKSEDENVDDCILGTIIGYYNNSDTNEEYYTISIGAYGECMKFYDDSKIIIIE